MENLEQCSVCEELTMDETHRRYAGMCESCFGADGMLGWRAVEETRDLI